MTFLRLFALVCILLAGAACTTPASRTAVSPVDGDVTGEPVAAADGDPIVCKRVVPTGTRVAQRTCMRRSEFDKARRDGHEMLEEVQRRGVQTGNVTKE